MEYAKKIAWPSIMFIGHISDKKQKAQIIKNATGLINLAKESFGIATLEALALWVPVLGFAKWGTKELVVRSTTGIFSEENEYHDSTTIADKIRQNRNKQLDRSNQHAEEWEDTFHRKRICTERGILVYDKNLEVLQAAMTEFLRRQNNGVFDRKTIAKQTRERIRELSIHSFSKLL